MAADFAEAEGSRETVIVRAADTATKGDLVKTPIAPTGQEAWLRSWMKEPV